jgi:hypothetical protein
MRSSSGAITGPLFKWFGSKWLSSKTLPKPNHTSIVEPYAGGAGYSLRHSERKVIIWDEDPNLQVLWPWLIQASRADILGIPIEIEEGTDIRTLGLTVGQQMLLKHWQRTNNCGDCWTISPWGNGQWTANTRARIAFEVGAIQHWRFESPNWNCERTTYFLDPPYLYNYRYRTGMPEFDFSKMVENVHSVSRSSQIIVCEAICPKTNRIPDYLPFTFFGNRITSRRKQNEHHHSKELIYVRS